MYSHACILHRNVKSCQSFRQRPAFPAAFPGSGDVPCLLSGCLKTVFCASGRQMPWFPEGKTRPISAHAGPASAPRNPGKGEVCMRTAAAALPRNRSASFAFRAAPVNGAEAPLFPADHDAEPFRLYRIRRCLPAGRACAFCIFAVYARRFRAFLLFFCTNTFPNHRTID